MKILKFGGSSIGTSESIREVGSIISDYHEKREEGVVVLSAMKGITDRLIDVSTQAAQGNESYLEKLKAIEQHHFDTARNLINVQSQSRVFAYIKTLINELDDLLHGTLLLKELSNRTLDLVLSFGERLSCFIVSQYLKELGIDAEFLDTRRLIKTDKSFGNARVLEETTQKNIQDFFSNNRALQVATGFIASTQEEETTTIGRGGSDYTASILGAALGAKEIEIWTDVNGVMTADPKVVKGAFSLESLTYTEAMEMSHFGAKVIYPPTMRPVVYKSIPLRIRNTFNRDFPGTLISNIATPPQEGFMFQQTKGAPIKGISSIENTSLITLEGSGMVGTPGVSHRLFGALAQRGINIILITQASSEHTITFAIDPEVEDNARKAIEDEFYHEIHTGQIGEVEVERNTSILAIIGENMRHTSGISGKLFRALGKNGINVRAIAQGSSEANLSVVIAKNDLSKALNSTHEAFFLSDTKTLNVFLVGLGLIGSTLLQQIRKQRDYLYNERFLKLNFIALANSRKMMIDANGIDLDKWMEDEDYPSEKTDMGKLIHTMKEMNLPNSVFVDCTSSLKVTRHYHEILHSSVSIITPNKLANSGPYKEYVQLKQAALKAGVKYLYETNVGAGLPVISVLQDLKDSGDYIYKVEGVLSGTLSYIFNSFVEGTKFSDVVKEAKEKGFTEPDPRDDLNGMDVARKILILAREVGLSIEPEDVDIENILPESCVNAPDIDTFFEELEKNNEVFDERRRNAEAEGKKLRFIAKLENGKANVNLLAVGPDHPFYSLSGSDNIISYTTARYETRPLVVKGPGAGAEVTAAGVFAEIISISNYLYNE